MDAANTRYKGINWVSLYRPYIISIPLLPDELLSTWLTRVALTCGCDPLSLSGVLWPATRVWTTDLDRGLSASQLTTLSQVSGIDFAVLDNASLRAVVAAVTGKAITAQAIWPWILALGTRNRKRHGGLQCCPSCLMSDKRPYYRKRWRYAWHIGCSQHQCMLIDRCPHCFTPLEPHRLLAGYTLTVCAHCQYDFRDTARIGIDENALAFQQTADKVVKNDIGRYGYIALSTNEWFLLSRYLIRLLRRAALGRTKSLIQFMQSFSIDITTLYSPATGLALELLPVEERSMLFGEVWRMLQAGPRGFSEAAKSCAMTVQSLKDSRQSIPKCIETILESMPSQHVRCRRKKGANLLSPKSHENVLRMWARLQRKIRAKSR